MAFERLSAGPMLGAVRVLVELGAQMIESVTQLGRLSVEGLHVMGLLAELGRAREVSTAGFGLAVEPVEQLGQLVAAGSLLGSDLAIPHQSVGLE